MPRTIELAPSILSANFANLAAHAQQALDGGGSLLHVDIMDGHFVPNITIGPPVVAWLRKALPETIFDCHLMIENPDDFIPAFAEAGASWISVHQEACIHLDRTLHHITDHGCQAGVVLNPATPVDTLSRQLDREIAQATTNAVPTNAVASAGELTRRRYGLGAQEKASRPSALAASDGQESSNFMNSVWRSD